MYVSTIRSHYRILGQEVDNEFLLGCMLRGVKNFNKGPRRIRYPLLAQQVSSMVEALPLFCTPYQQKLYRAMFYSAFHALMRLGEITNSPHNLLFSALDFMTR